MGLPDSPLPYLQALHLPFLPCLCAKSYSASCTLLRLLMKYLTPLSHMFLLTTQKICQRKRKTGGIPFNTKGMKYPWGSFEQFKMVEMSQFSLKCWTESSSISCHLPNGFLSLGLCLAAVPHRTAWSFTAPTAPGWISPGKCSLPTMRYLQWKWKSLWFYAFWNEKAGMKLYLKGSRSWNTVPITIIAIETKRVPSHALLLWFRCPQYGVQLCSHFL